MNRLQVDRMKVDMGMLWANESLSLVSASWALRWRITWLIKARISPWLRLKVIKDAARAAMVLYLTNSRDRSSGS